MPIAPGQRPLGLPSGLVWPVRASPDGPTPRQVRGLAWRRSSQGLYVPSATARSVEQRIVEAAAVLPAYGAVTGWAALRWLGASWFDGSGRAGADLPVTLALTDSSIRAQPAYGIAISEERLAPTHLQAHAGVRVTTAAYALLWEVRHARTDLAAVVLADMAAYSDLVSRAELSSLVARSPGWTGIDRGRKTVVGMEENAWSPAEVRMRAVWTDLGGHSRPWANRPVFDLNGHLIGTPDLLDPVAGVAGEYDSELHLDSARRRRDREREERFRSAGLEPVVMVTGDLADPRAFLSRLHSAYARAGRRPASDRGWTTEYPSWWVPTETVEQRRALTAHQRATWLRHRRRAG